MGADVAFRTVVQEWYMPIPSTGRARLAVSAVVLLAALSALPGVAIHARATFAPENQPRCRSARPVGSESFAPDLETHPMRCSVMFGDRSPATAPLNRRPSCGPPGAIAALVCKTFRSCLEPDGRRGCSSINHIGTGSRRASNGLADGACRPHTPSNITLRQPVRRACRRDTAASRPGPEWPGRTTD